MYKLVISESYGAFPQVHISEVVPAFSLAMEWRSGFWGWFWQSLARPCREYETGLPLAWAADKPVTWQRCVFLPDIQADKSGAE